ncbi:hypothetical protein GGI04_001753 [Coemansia thaxteri]|uniref:Calcipressin n=1 Tax=Coemansia thaxteri TaxID=2663907 RepID=A0A9W8BC45_9FUNG|nr:hypothetical protein H4R26_003910 [Coemansia thaxteri]KAJ2006780.1 hypothetical protein GGI04_001753 [Coemansia thaxteri]KAJ2471512.1 hypothetical protein GGI02_002225 [Coemansia sp. RSA 2322]KAJ2484556.1 hypothetical protein EV174_002346 [Coemansia sp. RSA 2320]
MSLNSLPRPEATNSLVVVFDSFTGDACVALRAKLEAHGPLCHFAKLKSFGRCLAVFACTADAQAAMRTLNSRPVLPGNNAHIYYSMHTSLSQSRNNFLKVPAQEKLWLISPPGSPPINWRQTREDPPNAKHLDHRLEAALQELSLGQFTLNPTDVVDYDSAESGDDALGDDIGAAGLCCCGAESETSTGSRAPAAGSGGQIAPTILIQNYDRVGASSSQAAMHGSRLAPPPILHGRPSTPNPAFKAHQPTARPPI